MSSDAPILTPILDDNATYSAMFSSLLRQNKLQPGKEITIFDILLEDSNDTISTQTTLNTTSAALPRFEVQNESTSASQRRKRRQLARKERRHEKSVKKGERISLWDINKKGRNDQMWNNAVTYLERILDVSFFSIYNF